MGSGEVILVLQKGIGHGVRGSPHVRAGPLCPSNEPATRATSSNHPNDFHCAHFPLDLLQSSVTSFGAPA